MNRLRGLAGVWMTGAMLALPASGGAADGPARLVKDINQVVTDDAVSSYPNGFSPFGDGVLFSATTHDFGFELWKSDGTAVGTSQVKDIATGPYSGLGWPWSFTPKDFVQANGIAYFAAWDRVHGWEPWRTDGTAAGTFLLKDILPGDSGSLDNRDNDYSSDTVLWAHAVAGGLMYFLANDGVHGFELWRTDGTPAGTFLLQDIQPGRASAFGGSGTYGIYGGAIGSGFCFRAFNEFTGNELWRTDGTTAGTVQLRDIMPGPESALPGWFATLNGVLIFPAARSFGDYELWLTDGTAAGTNLLADVVPGAGGSAPERLTLAGNLLYFESRGSLYRTDGTAAGTVRLRTFNSSIAMHGDLGGRLLLRADDGVHGHEPWISDGTPAGTVLVKDLHPDRIQRAFNVLGIHGGVAYALADDGTHGAEIWRTDGTPDGTRLLADLTPGVEATQAGQAVRCGAAVLVRTSQGLQRIEPVADAISLLAPVGMGNDIVSLGERVLFDGGDGEHGSELWVSDGTAAGTHLLEDVNPPRNGGSSPQHLGSATDPNGKTRALYGVYEGHDTDGFPVEGALWGSDGSSRGTTRIRTFFFLDDGSVGGKGATLDGIVYFAAAERFPNTELWRSDGTADGTWQVADIFPLPGWYGLHSSPVAAGGRLYFVAEDLEHGPELWTSDGTEAGTRMVGDFLPGPEGSYPGDLIVAGDTFFFTMIDAQGRQLWTSDGTDAGTHIVKDIARGPGSCCSAMVPFNGQLLFQAHDGVHGYEPWVSDGTEAGTYMLRDIVAGSGSAFYREAAVIGNSIFFQIHDGVHGVELWKSDGTTAGTVLVKDIRPGPESAFPSFLGPVGDALVFTTLDAHGRGWEVWSSDGSEAGTVPLGVFFPEDARAAATFEGGVLFSETDFEGRGLELWRTDGTAKGTTFVQDIAAGPAWSDPRNFVGIGTQILFVADDPVANRELFSGRAAILLAQPERALDDLKKELRALGLPRGIEMNLLAKLQPVPGALAAGRTTGAIVALENFVRQLDALTPRHVDTEDAADLIEFAQDLVTLVEKEPAPQPRPASGGCP